jgi:predicted enzyme related to lactoylglutathione lyase
MASNFIWYELMTTDLKAAEAFYTRVVGWSSEQWGSGDFPYVLMKVGDVGVGGLMKLPAEAAQMGQPPSWVGYIHTADVDKMTKTVRKAGGKVHREPSDIPDVGRFSVVADPQGATFMLLAPKGPDRPALAGWTPGRVGWHELYTTDWKKALAFYSKRFGWKKDQAIDMGEGMGTYQLFSVDGQQAGGMMNKPPQVPMPLWLFYFNVDDINATFDLIKAAGGNVMLGPMQVPGGSWVAQAMDPQGAMFAVVAQGS